ncbi:hypothetical protein AYI68_g1493, partial [Smittium mucronatum]
SAPGAAAGGLDISSIMGMASSFTGGGKSNSAPGGMDIMSLATSFLGGGNAQKQQSPVPSGIAGMLSSLLGGSKRDLESTNLAVDRSEAEYYHSIVYGQREFSRVNPEQLGAAAAVEALQKIQKTNEFDLNDEKVIAMVIAESVNIQKQYTSLGYQADNEFVSSVAVQTAVTILREASGY